MRKALIMVVAIAMLVSASTALAAGNSPTTSATVGNCISDGVYGNEPNMADGTAGGPAEQTPVTNGGNVLPSQSPGPWVNNPTDPDNPISGKSVGQWNQAGANIPQICMTLLGR